jgi:hypothetical protein
VSCDQQPSALHRKKADTNASTSDRKVQSSERPSRIIFSAKIAQKSLAKRR